MILKLNISQRNTFWLTYSHFFEYFVKMIAIVLKHQAHKTEL